VHGRRLHLGPAAHAAPALLQAVPLRAGLRSRLAVGLGFFDGNIKFHINSKIFNIFFNIIVYIKAF